MNEFSTYEYVVALKKDRRLAAKKAALIISYVLFPLLFILILCIIRLYWFICFAALATVLFILYTWRRFIDVEYEYSVTSGELTFSKIYGNASRKKVLTLKLSDAKMIAPYKDEYKEKAQKYAPTETVSALSGSDAEDAYCIIYDGEDGKTRCFLFEATERTLKICRFYNPSATVMSKVRY